MQKRNPKLFFRTTSGSFYIFFPEIIQKSGLEKEKPRIYGAF